MAEEIVIRLSAEGNASVQIGKVEKQLGDLDAQVKKTGSTFKNVFEIAAGNAIAQGVVKGFSLAVDAASSFAKTLVNDSIAASIEQENAINRLNRSLALSGDFTSETSQDFIDFAEALQRTSTVGDDVVLNQLAIAKSFGATNDQAKELVQAAVNLSSITGQDLDSAVKSLGGSLQGVSGQLGKTIPGIKELTQEQLRAGEAIQLVADRFRGAAAGELQTFSGANKLLANTFNDLQESIGSIITNNPAFVAAINEGSKILEDLKTFVDENAVSIRTNLTIALLAAADVALFFIASLEGVFQLLAKIPGIGSAFSAASSGIEELGVALARIRESAEGSLDDVAAGASTAKDPVNQLTTSINELSEAQRKALENGTKLAESLGASAGDSPRVTQLKQETAQLQILRDAQLITEEEFFARQAELRQEQFLIEQEQLAAAEEIRGANRAQIDAAQVASQQKLVADLNAIDKQRTAFEASQQKARLQAVQDSLSNLATLQSSGSKTAFRIGQAAAIAQAGINLFQGVSNALAGPPTGPPFPLNLLLATSIGAAQGANIAKIASAKPPGLQDGIDEVPSGFNNDTFPAFLSSGERVVPSKTNEDLRSFLNENQGTNNLLTQLISAVRESGNVMVNVGGETITNVVRRELESGGTLAVEA